MVLNARAGKPLPVYGDGQNVRDWLFVDDHCDAIRTVLARGRVGETYNIGGLSEQKNLDVVETLCAVLDELCPNDPVLPHRGLIRFVQDRPDMTGAMPLMRAKLSANLVGGPRNHLPAGFAKPCSGILIMTVGCGTLRPAPTGNGFPSNMRCRMPKR